MRLKLISCEVFYREMAAASARSPNHIEVDFISPGLHKGGPAAKLKILQEAIDASNSPRFQAVLLGYGLCGMDLAGLQARSIPLVIPKDTDCVTHLLNQQCPTRKDALRLRPAIHLHGGGLPQTGNNGAQEKSQPINRTWLQCGIDHLAAKYGLEVARYFTEGFQQVRNVPLQADFVRRQPMLLPPQSRERFKTQTQPPSCHRESLLIQHLVDGYWSYEHFLAVPPHWQVRRTLEGITAVQKNHE